jgi:hydrogenase expression/formation protein HypE
MSEDINFKGYTCPLPIQPNERVVIGHGSGGRLSHDLIERVFLPGLGKVAPRTLDDAAVLDWPGGSLAFTTDCHVVQPLFFAGGDIGRLAVCGTVNDLAMVGAITLALTAGFILEEGLALEALDRVVRSMRAAAEEAGVVLVAGDTKVVERGKADGLFITTSGVGRIHPNGPISGAGAQSGDVVLVSGTMGDHGIAVLSAREGLGFETRVRSDTAPLAGLTAAMLAAGTIHAMRDPTRGGLATTLKEISMQAGVCIELEEAAIPIREPVRAACEVLGFDPLYVANEGKLAACVPAADAPRILAAMRAHPYGADAAIIGRVVPAPRGQVHLRTVIGGTRIVDMLPGELLPRIC